MDTTQFDFGDALAEMRKGLKVASDWYTVWDTLKGEAGI